MQRHHLLPRQLLSQSCFGRFFEAIGQQCVGFDDFRRNGLLLPASSAAALRLRLPLHRGPHRRYNSLVAERVGQIEHGWSCAHSRAPEHACAEALMRIGLLQSALRKRLLAPDRPSLSLNRHCPLGAGVDFSELDAMAEALWAGTEHAVEA